MGSACSLNRDPSSGTRIGPAILSSYREGGDSCRPRVHAAIGTALEGDAVRLAVRCGRAHGGPHVRTPADGRPERGGVQAVAARLPSRSDGADPGHRPLVDVVGGEPDEAVILRAG